MLRPPGAAPLRGRGPGQGGAGVGEVRPLRGQEGGGGHLLGMRGVAQVSQTLQTFPQFRDKDHFWGFLVSEEIHMTETTGVHTWLC